MSGAYICSHAFGYHIHYVTSHPTMGILKYWSKTNCSAELLLRCFVPRRSPTQRRRMETTGGSGIVLGRWPDQLVAPSATAATNRVRKPSGLFSFAGLLLAADVRHEGGVEPRVRAPPAPRFDCGSVPTAEAGHGTAAAAPTAPAAPAQLPRARTPSSRQQRTQVRQEIHDLLPQDPLMIGDDCTFMQIAVAIQNMN